MTHFLPLTSGVGHNRLARLALITLAALGAALPAAAVTHHVDVLLDLDNDAATGCTVATSDGPFEGVEQILRSVVETESVPAPAATVVEVVRLECVGGAAFGPPVVVDPGDWPVGVGLGVSGSDVVETYFPADALPPGIDTIRLGVTLTALGSGEEAALLFVSEGSDQPILFRFLTIVEIPTLSEWGLLLLVGLLALAAAHRLRRRGTVAALVALLALGGAGLAWAAVSLDGDPSDWAPGDQLAGTPPAACNGLRVAALFAKSESGQLCLRIDACLNFNTAPVAADDAFTTPEDTPLNGNVLVDNGSGADTDADGDPLTVDTTPISGPTNGTLVLAANGDFTYTPNADFNGTDSFEYQITDGNGGSDTATVTITVTAVNDAPVVDPAAFSVPEDATVGTVVGSVTFSDPDTGQSHTFAITGGNTGGAFAIDATSGEITVAAALDFETLNSYSLTVEVTDDGVPVLSGSNTVTITVTDVDDAPLAVDDAATVTEDDPATTVDVLANDTDTDGGPISVQSVTQPTNGTVAITNAGADLTYAPNADYCNDPPGTTPDTFTYTLNGGSTATVSVTVTCEDDDPVAVDDAATVTEDDPATTIDVLTNDTDVDAGPISITSVTQPANGTVVITNAGADLTYQPDADYCNTPPGTTLDTFTYTLTPGGSTATVSVTVTCEDDAPIAVADAATVAEDSGANTIDVQANDTDVDGGTNTVTAVTQPANGTVAITNGGADVSYTPNANYCNDPPGTTLDTFTYTLTPGGSSTTVTVTVTCVDDPPAAVNDAATIGEDSGANTVDVLANDVDLDGGAIAVVSVTQPANGTVAITNAGADVSYTPNADYCNNPPGTTPDTFTYTLAPGGSVATVSVTVTCVNDGPLVDLDADDDKGTGGNDFAATFTEATPATLIVDPDDPTGAIVTDIDSATLASLTVTITNLLDTGAETLSADVTGTSIVANYVPATGVLTLTGPDTLANFTTVLRTVRYHNSSLTPDETARVVHFVANDGGTDGNTAVSTVTVVAVDTAPTAVDDTATVNEDSVANAVDVLLNDTDPDGGPISVDSVTQPTNGSVAITGGGTGVSYTPNAEYCNSVSGVDDSFTYTLDPGGSTATVDVTVTCVDDNPTAVADAATVVEDSGANAIDVLGNDTDPDGGPISVTSVTQPANGTAAITGGGTGVTYAPNANYCNSPPGTTLDTFTYTLTPGGSSTTVTVTVTCVDDDPVAVADAATVVEDSGANAVDVLGNDTDVDGGAISVTSVTQPANGTAAITGGGTGVSYAPNANYCNDPPGTTLETFTYTLTPGGSSTTVTVTVTCVDDPPTAVADAATVIEDSGANTIDVQANDTDVDGGANTITGITQPANGAVAITNAGADLTYTPNLNYCNDPPGTTLDTFTYTLTPGGSSTTVTVTVTCVNDPPVLANDPITYSTAGNTQLHVAGATLAGVASIADASSALTKSLPTDVDGPAAPTVVPASGATTGGGSYAIAADGSFTYVPPVGFTGADSFIYQVTDSIDTTAGTVSLTVSELVWYVRDVVDADNAAGGDGRSTDAFEALASAAPPVTPDDYVFVFAGNTAVTPHDGDFVIDDSGVKLHGEGIGLTVPGFGTLVPAGSRPRLINQAVDTPALEDNGVTVAATAGSLTGVEIRGLDISGRDNGIDVTATGANNASVTISDNTVGSNGTTGLEGIDVNAAGTGTVTVTVSNNTLSGRGNAFDARSTVAGGALRVALSNHVDILSPNGSGVVIDGSLGGTTTVTAFANNSVHQATGGSGIVVNSARFDADPIAAGYQQVSGGNTRVGIPGDAVGASGVLLTNVTGDLAFTDLDIFAGPGDPTGAGLRVVGTGAVNTGAGTGTRVTVTPNAGIVQTTTVRGVDVQNATLDLQLNDLDVASASTTAVWLVNVADGGGTNAAFTAPSGSTITTTAGAGATIFNVSGGNAKITYAGTINNTGNSRALSIDGWAGDDAGDDVLFSGAITENGSGILVNGNGGSRSITFSGGLTINTTTGQGFAATSNTNTGGLHITGTNTINSTSATALRVTNTTIGSSNLNFRSISSGNNTAAADPANGIVLTTTGSTGRLIVTGAGSSAVGGDNSGGTIQRTTGAGISLTDTTNPSFTNLTVNNTTGDGVLGTRVSGFTFQNGRIEFSGAAAGESNLSFRGDVAGANANLSGVVTISGNVLTNAFYHGVDIQNYTGTISNATISNNVLTSSTVGASSQGSGIRLIAFGTAGSAAHVSQGTISGNNIDNFPTGDGIQVQGGNPASTVTGTTMGTAGGGASVEITGNFVAGASSANKLGGNAILAAFRGSGQANVNITGNGTVADPIANVAGIGIAYSAFGTMTMTGTISNNVLAGLNNTFGSQGILAGLDDHFGAAGDDAGTMTVTINGNSVSGTDGNGIQVLARNSAATINAKVQNNTVAAPLGGVRPGIRVDSGSATGDTRVCLNISGNTTAGSGGPPAHAGIGLRKQGTTASVNEFAIHGLATSPASAAQVEAFVTGNNPGSAGGTLVISGDNFNQPTCSFP